MPETSWDIWDRPRSEDYNRLEVIHFSWSWPSRVPNPKNSSLSWVFLHFSRDIELLTIQVCEFYTRSKFWASSWPNDRHAREPKVIPQNGHVVVNLTNFYKNVIDFPSEFSPRFLPGSKYRLCLETILASEISKALKSDFKNEFSTCTWGPTGLRLENVFA